jgi:hypothetical protein
VFEPNSEVLAAATEFKIARALQSALDRWVMINGVQVEANQETLQIEVVYTKRADLERERVRFQLLPGEGANRG